MKIIKYIFFVFLNIICLNSLFAQTKDTISIADISQKLTAKDTDTLYFGFAENDILLLDIDIKRKSVESFEILEVNGNSIFKALNVSELKQKSFKINRKCVLVFLMKHKGLRGTSYTINLKRIPFSEKTVKFNTNVKWKAEYDTTFEFIKEKKLVRNDTLFEILVDQTARVHSMTSINFEPNRTVIPINISNEFDFWTCWISVGTEGRKAYSEARKNIGNSIANIAGYIPEYGPLISIGIKGAIALSEPTGGDNIIYGITNKKEDSQKFLNEGTDILYIKTGNVVKDIFKIKNDTTLNKVYLCLKNDNIREGIDVDIKAIAFKIKPILEMVHIKKIKSIVYNKSIPININ